MKPPRALSERQLAAARLVVRGLPHGQVARELKLHRTTLTRWRALPQFRHELDRLRQEAEAKVAFPAASHRPAAWARRPARRTRLNDLPEGWTAQDEQDVQDQMRRVQKIADNIFAAHRASIANPRDGIG